MPPEAMACGKLPDKYLTSCYLSFFYYFPRNKEELPWDRAYLIVLGISDARCSKFRYQGHAFVSGEIPRKIQELDTFSKKFFHFFKARSFFYLFFVV